MLCAIIKNGYDSWSAPCYSTKRPTILTNLNSAIPKVATEESRLRDVLRWFSDANQRLFKYGYAFPRCSVRQLGNCTAFTSTAKYLGQITFQWVVGQVVRPRNSYGLSSHIITKLDEIFSTKLEHMSFDNLPYLDKYQRTLDLTTSGQRPFNWQFFINSSQLINKVRKPFVSTCTTLGPQNHNTKCLLVCLKLRSVQLDTLLSRY